MRPGKRWATTVSIRTPEKTDLEGGRKNQFIGNIVYLFLYRKGPDEFRTQFPGGTPKLQVGSRKPD